MLAWWAVVALAGPVSDQFKRDYRLTWLGIDFTEAEFFVPDTFDSKEESVYWGPGGGLDDFVDKFENNDAARIKLSEDWNAMIVNETVPWMKKKLAADVVVSLAEADGPTERWTGAPFRSEFDAARVPAHFGEADVARRVQALNLTGPGIGLVLVAERFSKTEAKACSWPTYVDLGTKAVLHTERVCKEPGGGGFRNFWLNPLRDTVRESALGLKEGKW